MVVSVPEQPDSNLDWNSEKFLFPKVEPFSIDTVHCHNGIFVDERTHVELHIAVSAASRRRRLWGWQSWGRRSWSCTASTTLNVAWSGTQPRSSRSRAFSRRDALATRTGPIVDTAMVVTGTRAKARYRAFCTLGSILACTRATRAGARLSALDCAKRKSEDYD